MLFGDLAFEMVMTPIWPCGKEFDPFRPNFYNVLCLCSKPKGFCVNGHVKDLTFMILCWMEKKHLWFFPQVAQASLTFSHGQNVSEKTQKETK